MPKRRVLVLGFFCVATVMLSAMSACSGQKRDGEVVEDVIGVLKEAVGSGLTVKKEPPAEFEVCPDNTCDLFVAGDGVPIQDLAKASLLYEYFFSDSVLLDGWRRSKTATSLAIRLTKDVSSGAPEVERREHAAEFLSTLSKKSRLSLYFVRYDEGVRAVVPIKIEEMLRGQ